MTYASPIRGVDGGICRLFMEDSFGGGSGPQVCLNSRAADGLDAPKGNVLYSRDSTSTCIFAFC
jgi:hypothetical protein